jgi:beta-glucosidase
VQFYVSDLYASVAPPVRRLRGFEKIELDPETSRLVTFRLPMADLAFVGTNNRFVLEPGEFQVSVGGLTQRFAVR